MINMKRKSNNWWLMVLPSSGNYLLNGILITNRFLPEGDISYEKKAVYQSFDIPGLDYQLFDWVRNEDARITLKIPFINKKEKQLGATMDANLFERPGIQQIDITSSTSEALWKSNPVCLYSGWGTHKPPGLPVMVENGVKLTFLRDHVNKAGNPTFGYAEMTLRYIESHKLYKQYKYGQLLAGAYSAIKTSKGGYPI